MGISVDFGDSRGTVNTNDPNFADIAMGVGSGGGSRTLGGQPSIADLVTVENTSPRPREMGWGEDPWGNLFATAANALAAPFGISFEPQANDWTGEAQVGVDWSPFTMAIGGLSPIGRMGASALFDFTDFDLPGVNVGSFAVPGGPAQSPPTTRGGSSWGDFLAGLGTMEGRANEESEEDRNPLADLIEEIVAEDEARRTGPPVTVADLIDDGVYKNLDAIIAAGGRPWRV